MITLEETEELLERLKESRPKKMMEHLDKEDVGIMHVMRILHTAGEPVTAGKISEEMNVSTARVAVLLKKMEQKNLVVRSKDSKDARKTLIGISEYGKEQAQIHKNEFLTFCALVIEETGVERFKEFIAISEEIKVAVEEQMKLCQKNKLSQG